MNAPLWRAAFIMISTALLLPTSLATIHYFDRVPEQEGLFQMPSKSLEQYKAVHDSLINFEPLWFLRYSMHVRCLPECNYAEHCSLSFMLNNRFHVNFATDKDHSSDEDRLVQLMILYDPQQHQWDEYIRLELINEIDGGFGCEARSMGLEFIPQPQKVKYPFLSSREGGDHCNTAAGDTKDSTGAATDSSALDVDKEMLKSVPLNIANSSHAKILSHVKISVQEDTLILTTEEIKNQQAQRIVNDQSLSVVSSSSFSVASTITTTTTTTSMDIGPDSDASLLGVSPPRILCSIYTIESHHKSHILPLIETWAGKCTGFLVFSNVTDDRFPSVAIPHLGPERYDMIWQKVRSIWSYIYTNYRDDFEFFFISGDDSYVIVENLIALLVSPHVQEQHKTGRGTYLGRMYLCSIQTENDQGEFSETGEFMYNHGGPGYVLDRAALQRFFLYRNHEHCLPMRPTSSEDECIAYCLSRSPDVEHGLLPFNTADQFGRQRFHVFPPGEIARKPLFKKDYFHAPNCDAVDAANCVSSSSVAFHNIDGDLMRSMHQYLYNDYHRKCKDR